MEKYYTRACNFFYTSKSGKIKKNHLPLNGNSGIKFKSIELLTRKSEKIINLDEIKKLPFKFIVIGNKQSFLKACEFSGIKSNSLLCIKEFIDIQSNLRYDNWPLFEYESRQLLTRETLTR